MSWRWGGPTKSFQILFFCFFCFLDVFGFLAKNAKTFGKTKRNNIPEILAMGGFSPRVSKYCFLFSQCFLISLHGVLPKRLKVFFLCYHYMEVYTDFFSVYGTKWWTDNLKSRQVERVLTKFKGCEPSCRKVQKVAALVGSGGVTIYIYVCVCMSCIQTSSTNIITKHPSMIWGLRRHHRPMARCPEPQRGSGGCQALVGMRRVPPADWWLRGL